jgi:hypothetical protein
MKKGLMLAVIVCLAAACVVSPPVATTPEEADYLAKVNAQPLTFRIPAAQSNDAWGRIQSWISRFSPFLKMKLVTDYVIETEDANIMTSVTMYSVSRAPMGEQVEFIVRGWNPGGSFSPANVNLKVHILAYYAATGELIEKFIKQ